MSLAFVTRLKGLLVEIQCILQKGYTPRVEGVRWKVLAPMGLFLWMLARACTDPRLTLRHAIKTACFIAYRT